MRKASCLVLVAVLLLFCLFSSLAWLAPAYLNSRFIPELSKRYGLPGLTMTVGHLGLNGIIVEDLVLADAKGRGIHIDSLSCRYSFKNLISKKEIEKCVVRGARVDLEPTPGGISLAGVAPLLAGQEESSSRSGSEKANWQLPITVRTVELERAHFSLEQSGRTVVIPLSLSLFLDRPLSASSELPFALHCNPLGQDVRMQGRINLASHAISMHFAVQSDLAQLPVLLNLPFAGEAEGRVDLTGGFTGQYAPFAIGQLEGHGDISLRGQYGDWRIGSDRKPDKNGTQIQLALQQGGRIKLALPDLWLTGPATLAIRNIELRLDPQAELLEGNFLLSDVSAAASGTGSVMQVKGDLPVSFRFAPQEGTLSFATGAGNGQNRRATALAVTLGDRVRGHADLSVHGTARFQGSGMKMQSRVQLAKGKVDLPGQQLMISGITADIPVQFPWSKEVAEEEGSARADAVQWRTRKLAGVDLRIAQHGPIYRFVGKIQEKVLGGAPLQISGMVDVAGKGGGPEFDGKLQLERIQLKGFSLKKAGLAQDVQYSGFVSADASADFRQGHLAAKATLAMEEGNIEWPAKDLAVSGLNASFTFADLPKLQSLPARLRFASIKAGGLGFGAGLVNIQLEPGETILVEKGNFKWCGGTVHALAMRIPLTGKQFAADLYCDRLNLAELLHQFGIKDASGVGSVNGHIPVSYGDGKFLFEDGFLYSTPGGGGTIQVKALDLLTGGIPKNSPQFAQLDFAGAALRDFAYNWVKLSLVSEGDDIVLKMNIDGKPAHPLPFYYDQKTGTFNRLKVSSEKGINQPIVLDVNFRIPFNQLLGYGKSIKQVIDLMR